MVTDINEVRLRKRILQVEEELARAIARPAPLPEIRKLERKLAGLTREFRELFQ